MKLSVFILFDYCLGKTLVYLALNTKKYRLIHEISLIHEILGIFRLNVKIIFKKEEQLLLILQKHIFPTTIFIRHLIVSVY
jgi:hypothetical protein